MKISVSYISHTGKRQANEDSILCLPAQGLFIVCDGVGGSNKGGVASWLACDTIAAYFASKAITEKEIDLAIKKTEEEFTAYINNHPEAAGMATTLTLLALNGNSAIIAHIGDSRVYHIRKSNILFRTQDHSLINEWLASGFIQPHEAKNHPQKNIITRSLRGAGNPTSASLRVLRGLQQGDYFILCSDGILEGVSENILQNLCARSATVAGLAQEIEMLCAQKSYDNYSAIFVQLVDVPQYNQTI